MGENSKIEWTDHTFNPWVGCAKVSPACTHCYAEGWARRTGQPGLWRGERRKTSAANWRYPRKWSQETPGARVFCASLADVFEEHPAILPEWREELWSLTEETDLTWLLLTKRPENIQSMVPADWMLSWPRNVWVGTTVEDQQRADERIPHLLQVPAPVRFLSCEPLVGFVKLDPLWMETGNPPLYSKRVAREASGWVGGIDWVIAGGESGPKARPSHPDWFRSLRDQCSASNVPFHFKQWGEWCEYRDQQRMQGSQCLTMDGRHRSEPGVVGPGDAIVVRVGKTAAGRLLDGVSHDGVPRGR